MLAAIPALAHSWYPLACCGNMDCFPVACDQLVETISGWLYVPTGNLFTREQVQPSQDHLCHVCVGLGRDHRFDLRVHRAERLGGAVHPSRHRYAAVAVKDHCCGRTDDPMRVAGAG
jgi:hypothetical protein